MSDTYRDKKQFKLKQFNDQFLKTNEHLRGNTNRWMKELSIETGIEHYEIGDLFPRDWREQRKGAARAYRSAVKQALRTGRPLPEWEEYFDYWMWD